MQVRILTYRPPPFREGIDSSARFNSKFNKCGLIKNRRYVRRFLARTDTTYLKLFAESYRTVVVEFDDASARRRWQYSFIAYC